MGRERNAFFDTLNLMVVHQNKTKQKKKHLIFRYLVGVFSKGERRGVEESKEKVERGPKTGIREQMGTGVNAGNCLPYFLVYDPVHQK